MARRAAFIFLLSLAPPLLCVAQSGARDRPTFQAEVAGKAGALREYANRFARQRVSTFYVARARNDDGKEYLYAYWKEDNSILLLDHFDSVEWLESDHVYGWLRHKATIDLATEVVPTRGAIGGSTFLVDRPWVNRIINACLRGEKLVIRKRARAANGRGRQ